MKFSTLLLHINKLIRKARKPTKEEINKIARMTGSLMILLGLMGVVVSLAFNLI